MASVQKRKLIEVALPLEAINKASAKEKSIRHGHPSTLHLWWARRPLAAARAVLFSQLVDDPSSDPDKSEEDQRREREDLHRLISELVRWENTSNEEVLARARTRILASTGGKPPAILDPFAGGGTIPLEAQRLGLAAHASDLNPVAVLINKALIEIPPLFRDQEPVFPGVANGQIRKWKGAEGLAADVRAYGAWIRDEAVKRIGHLYPKADNNPVIAWLWARTVTCPNPACGIQMPLVRSWCLSKKKGKEAYVLPSIVPDGTHPSGQRVQYSVGRSPSRSTTDGTMSGRRGATCVACGATVDKDHIKAEGMAGRMGASLMAVVAESGRQRVYLPPSREHEDAAKVDRPADIPEEELGYDPRNLWTPQYGLTRFADLFTNRQLVALATFCDLVGEARERALKDAVASGMPEGERLQAGGSGASAYSDAIATLLGLCASKMAVFHTSLSRWRADADKTAPAFGRQAIAMVWDFAETMPFAGAGGDWLGVIDGAARALERLRPSAPGRVSQEAVQDIAFAPGLLLSTDPPYYSNISYADLSDYFYLWLRRTQRSIWPETFRTVLTPKAEELVANPYRNGGEDGARDFFVAGFRSVFERARNSATNEYPIAVYYAYKQSDTDDDGVSSSGWETLLDGMVNSGWSITATWPMRTEGETRLVARDANSLASSIVLSLRPRPADAPTVDRRGFISALHTELPDALRRLQQGQIAPVDLPQAAIGPGMAVFSRYAAVIEDDGSQMSVRSALARINEILDQVLNEQEGDFDATTRFAIAWYRQHGYTTGKFGDADNLARARNTAVETMARDGVLTSGGNKVTLLRPADLDPSYDIVSDQHVGAWEALHHLIRVLESGGVGAAGALLAQAASRPNGPVDGDLVKELAFLLFSIAEKNGWTKDALAFNTLATSWADIVDASRTIHSEQLSLDYGSDE